MYVFLASESPASDSSPAYCAKSDSLPAARIARPRVRGRRVRAAAFSPGLLIIAALALISASLIALRPSAYADHELEMWSFTNEHVDIYRPIIAQWNAAHPDIRVELNELSLVVEQQRLMSGFYSQTPIADLMEIERGKIGALFAAPLANIGLYDLTPYLERDHLFEQINAPSFGPWTTRGHVFGLPHDVHPVMLAYRSDIVEAAGIDVRQIETWEDYVRVMSPLMKDVDREGRPKHYLLNVWPTAVYPLEMLILQAGGGYFDGDGRPIVNSDVMARVLSQVVVWSSGPTRIGIDAPEFDGGGNQLRVEGYVIGSLMPDWLSGLWRGEMPQLSGKVKLMPLPAWEKGGRRTTVWGGTMLGISKRTRDFEKAWTFAKELYTSQQAAEKLYRGNGIVSPVKKMWSNPIYDEPVEYFCGQPAGRLFLNLAKEVPLRTSSPYHTEAIARVQEAIVDLQQYANDRRIYEVEKLMPEARRLLGKAEASLLKTIQQNLIVDPAVPLHSTATGRG